jgi:hypothetical protein
MKEKQLAYLQCMLLDRIEIIKEVDHFLFYNMYYSSHELMKRIKRDGESLSFINNRIFINDKDGLVDVLEDLSEIEIVLSFIIREKKNKENILIEKDDIDNIKDFYKKNIECIKSNKTFNMV